MNISEIKIPVKRAGEEWGKPPTIKHKYYKASDVIVEKNEPTSMDKERKDELLNEFKSVVDEAKVQPPGTSNFPFSSKSYHKSKKSFLKKSLLNELKSLHGTTKYSGGKKTKKRRTKRSR